MILPRQSPPAPRSKCGRAADEFASSTLDVRLSQGDDHVDFDCKKLKKVQGVVSDEGYLRVKFGSGGWERTEYSCTG